MTSLWSERDSVKSAAPVRTTSWFDVIDQGTGQDYLAVRERIDAWWQNAPEPLRTAVAGQLHSRNDASAHAAITELYLANELQRIGLLVKSGTLGIQTPDFLCTSRRGFDVIVEVTSLNPSTEHRQQEQRVNELLDALDAQNLASPSLPNTMLHVTTWSVGRDSAPRRAVISAVREWLDKAGPIADKSAWLDQVPFAAEPTLWWIKGPSSAVQGEFTTTFSDQGDRHQHARNLQQQGYTWVVSFTRIPAPRLGEEHGGSSLFGRVAIHGPGRAEVLPASRVPSALRDKVKKYGGPAREANLPLVVAVADPDWISPVHHDLAALDKLFRGSFTETLAPGPSGWVSLGVTRNDDGLWTRPRMRHLDGVIVVNSQRWHFAELSVTAFAINPESTHVAALQEMRDSWPALSAGSQR